MILLYARTFLETYRTQSVTRAAENLNITQPAASSHIKGLENYLRRPLFLRQGRGISPTVFADELAHALSTPLDKVEQTLIDARKLSTKITGTVHIAGPNEFLTFMASQSVFQLPTSDIKLRFRTGNRSFIKSQLESSQTDLAIFAHEFLSPTTEKETLYTELLIPVASPEWIAMHLGMTYDLQDLLVKPLVTYDEDLTMINHFFAETLGCNYASTARVSVPDLRAVKTFVVGGEGFSVLPDYLVAEELENNVLVNLNRKYKSPSNNLYLVWNKTNLREERVAFVKKKILEGIKNC